MGQRILQISDPAAPYLDGLAQEGRAPLGVGEERRHGGWPCPSPSLGPLLWVKTAKPQDYVKSQGCHPVPTPHARGGGGGSQVRVSPPLGPWLPGPAPSSPPLTGTLGGALQAGGRKQAQGAGLAHPTPPSVGGASTPQQGASGHAGRGPVPPQVLCPAGLGTEGSHWGSHTSLNGPQTRRG